MFTFHFPNFYRLSVWFPPVNFFWVWFTICLLASWAEHFDCSFFGQSSFLAEAFVVTHFPLCMNPDASHRPWPTGFSLPLSQTFWWDIQATKYGWELETWVWGSETLWDLDLGMWKWIWMRKETYFQVLLRRSSVEEQSHLSKFPDALTVTLILSPPQQGSCWCLRLLETFLSNFPFDFST